MYRQWVANLFCRSINFLNKWRLFVYYMFRVMFAYVLHDLITFHLYWMVLLLHSNINLHLFISSLHNQHSLAGAWFYFWWKSSWIWIQLVPRCWWLSPYFKLVRLSHWLWWYISETHQSTLVDKLFLSDNLKRRFFLLFISNLHFLLLLDWLWFWRVNKCVFIQD